MVSGFQNDAPIEAIEQCGHEYGDSGLDVTRVDCRHDREKPGKHGAGREQVWQQVDSTRALARAGRCFFHAEGHCEKCVEFN